MTIGIAIALYNGERFIRKQLDSLLQQTQQPDKVIFCDDGSKDGTVNIVKSYIAEHGLEEKWQLFINPQNLGYARNFYHAMELCNTDLIFLCDQDDLWDEKKIEKMTLVMENNPQIMVLSSKFGIIDADDRQMHSVLESKAAQTNELRQISHRDLLTAFYWPGMVMCVRGDFFVKIADTVAIHSVAHDRVFAHCAAEQDGFYEIDYIGAYHRRHNCNTAHEEHRIFKLLNLQRKLRDIDDHNQMLEGLLNLAALFGENTVTMLEERLTQSKQRQTALKNRSLRGILQLYANDKTGLLRKASLLCDLWLVCFGNYQKGV